MFTVKTEHIAVGVLINQNNQFLIAQRSAGKHLGGKWEFPGGKVEDGETSQQALKREMQEELGIEICSALLFTKVTHKYTEKKVMLDFYKVNKWQGEPKGMEGQPLLWVAGEELKNYDFPDANLAVINQHLLKN